MSERQDRADRPDRRTRSSSPEALSHVIRLAPYKYVHILDTNSNVSRVLAGPLTYTRQEHEQVLGTTQSMIVLPAQHYVEILNPVIREKDGAIARDQYAQAKLRHGELEIRIFDQYPEPFPLFPGEVQQSPVRKLRVVTADHALRIRALRKFDEHVAGDEWLFVGPATYYPRVEEEVVTEISAITIQKNTALKFRAERKCKDSLGVERDAGEEWLVRKCGAYLPQVDEVLVETVYAHVLTDREALHLRALRTFQDVYGQQRKAGEEWLITADIAETHLQDVHEQVVGKVEITTLTTRQYCVIVDPVIDGVQKRGTRELRKGESSFFLQPGEQLEDGQIQDVLVLAEDEAVLLRANEPFVEQDPAGKEYQREAGERWMVHGPREYIPPIEVQVLEVRQAIPLDTNEGVYVRERKTGHVRSVKGKTFMLQATEELWEKYLLPDVEALLTSQRSGSYYADATNPFNPSSSPSSSSSPSIQQNVVSHQGVAASADPPSPMQMQIPMQAMLHHQGLPSNSTPPIQRQRVVASLGRNVLAPRLRDKTKVVKFEVPHNAAVQVYDYKSTSSRIAFGPTLVMLEPEEQFTVLRLSGGMPKQPNAINTLCLMLGPDFMRDQIVVETSDHARLRLTLAYNWRFLVNPQDRAEAIKIFNVKDFVGDACKTLASRIRGAVAVESFDHFHKHSAKIIRTSIFGMDDNGKLRPSFLFEANNLCITNVDIQSAEPVDQLTRESLQKSVQLAIEITTKSQEARAKSQAMKEEEEANGQLVTQQLENQAAAEQARKNLVQLSAECAAVEAEGDAVGKAKAAAQAAEIEGLADVRRAELRAQADRIAREEELRYLREESEVKVLRAKQLAEVEIQKKRELMTIEAEKFQQMVASIGTETLVEMARVGPETQVKMLQALGLNGYLITDGKSPVNLVGTAGGLINSIAAAAPSDPAQTS